MLQNIVVCLLSSGSGSRLNRSIEMLFFNEKNEPLCVYFILFCEFNEYSEDSAFIAELMCCFYVIIECLLVKCS